MSRPGQWNLFKIGSTNFVTFGLLSASKEKVTKFVSLCKTDGSFGEVSTYLAFYDYFHLQYQIWPTFSITLKRSVYLEVSGGHVSSGLTRMKHFVFYNYY